ncbi:MAG: hypothetical protein KHX55_07275 [Proteobacteria bacterium]|nr:hypothetical protein [Pseudomonadota bacterium]
MAYSRPKPFGILFAYKLTNNSLASLCENIKEWEKENSPEHYPNLIVVLNNGIVSHRDNYLKDCIFNEDLKEVFPSAIHYEKDSLFKFYSILIDLCAHSKARQFDLMSYFDPSFFVGNLVVQNHNRFTKTAEKNNKVYKLTDKFIHKVYNWCQKTGKIINSKFFLQCIGAIPQGIDPTRLDEEVYLYNPDNLPPNDNKYEKINNCFQKANTGTLAPPHFIYINRETYYIPFNYINENVIELEPNITSDYL